MGETYGRCTVCNVDIKVSNKRKGLTKHSRTIKHLTNMGEMPAEGPTFKKKKKMNNSAWHDHMFEKGFLNTSIENHNFQKLQEYILPKIDIESESEDCSNSVDPQPDSTNNQKNISFGVDLNECTNVRCTPKISLKGFHERQISSSNIQDETEDSHQITENINESNLSLYEKQSLLFGKLIANEMVGINDQKTLAKFKEKILQVIVNYNKGN